MEYLSREAFVQRLFHEIDVDDGDGEAELVTQYGVDSLSAMLLVLATEELSGTSAEASDVPSFSSMNDLYEHYVRLMARR